MDQCHGMTVQSINDIVTEYSNYQGNSTPLNYITQADLKVLCVNEWRHWRGQKRVCQHKPGIISEPLAAGVRVSCIAKASHVNAFQGILYRIFFDGWNLHVSYSIWLFQSQRCIFICSRDASACHLGKAKLKEEDCSARYLLCLTALIMRKIHLLGLIFQA